MLYVVLLPVKRDRIRRLAIVHAEGYADVLKMLGLSDNWQSWVSFTDYEVENMMSCPEQSITKFICKEAY